jgi:TatD DNase family protein
LINDGEEFSEQDPELLFEALHTRDQKQLDIDLKHIVLETDAPYLAPVPHRGKRNESAFLRHVAEKLAELKQCSLHEVAEVTTQNSIHIFGV